MKKLLITAMAALLALSLVSCTDKGEYTLSGTTAVTEASGTDSAEQSADDIFSESDLDDTVPDDAVKVTFDEKMDSAAGYVTGNGASFSVNVLNITSAGTYVLSGTLYGSVRVSVSKEEKVRVILSGAEIYSEDSAALYVESADKVTVTLAEGTDNVLSDGVAYAAADGAEPNACLYSKDDLTINGTGSLTVKGNSRNGIVSKDDLKIVSGEITVSACKNAIKGKDSLTIGGGTVTVSAAIDALKSDNDTDAAKGFILITGGEISLICDDDALQATTSITATGGKITAAAKDNTTNCDGEVSIAEGVLTEK